MSTIIVRAAEESAQAGRTTPDRAVTRQIDELQRLAEEERNRQLGPTWFDELRDFYCLTGYATVASPSFRPRVVLPELQTMCLAEATDISESLPQVYVTEGRKRDEQREKAYQAHWRAQGYNLQLLVAQVWSLFAGNGFVQVGVDPYGRRGKGEVWLAGRDPATVYPDPGPVDPKDWLYVIIEDKMYLDEIVRRYPGTGERLKAKAHGVVRTDIGEPSHPGGLSLPQGPMLYGSGGPPEKQLSGDGRLIVRHCFVLDFSRRDLDPSERAALRDKLGPLVPVPSKVQAFPDGRWLTDCEGVVLADGPFYLPFRKFPIVPIRSMPALQSFWVPPPVRYTKALQELSERLLTGVYENSVRLNNGTWFIDERTGITADDFGGIPAEVRVIHAASPTPVCTYPPPMPPHFVQLPQLLLEKSRSIQGFTPMRQGQPAPGNIGQALYDATVFQSQVLTRMRAKLLAPAMQEIAELVFYAMCRYYRDDQLFPGFGGGTFESTTWKSPLSDIDAYDVFLDPDSIRPLSGSATRSLILALMQKDAVPLGYGLEQLGLPHAQEIAEEERQQKELAAMAKVKRPR